MITVDGEPIVQALCSRNIKRRAVVESMPTQFKWAAKSAGGTKLHHTEVRTCWEEASVISLASMPQVRVADWR
eukprot:scaffold321091_cov33-Tisochrysis_lutea.AAC.1